LFNAVEHLPCVKRKADWALDWINPDKVSVWTCIECGSKFL
jgi:hypothetical protein